MKNLTRIILTIITNAFKKIKNVFDLLEVLTTYLIDSLDDKLTLEIQSRSFNKNGRFFEYRLINKSLLEGDDILRAIYNTLMNDETYLKFGEVKVIIVSAISPVAEYNYHHNVLIKNSTTFDEYHLKVQDIINSQYDQGYKLDAIIAFKVII